MHKKYIECDMKNIECIKCLYRMYKKICIKNI